MGILTTVMLYQFGWKKVIEKDSDEFKIIPDLPSGWAWSRAFPS